MPTGYTAIIEERADLSFRDFALRCARGMCACVMQRDDPMDELPKARAQERKAWIDALYASLSV